MGSLKIFYSEIIDLKLNKSNLSSLYSSIVIVYSKNGYTKHLISLSSSDGFAVRWFYDELVVIYFTLQSYCFFLIYANIFYFFRKNE